MSSQFPLISPCLATIITVAALAATIISVAALAATIITVAALAGRARPPATEGIGGEK